MSWSTENRLRVRRVVLSAEDSDAKLTLDAWLIAEEMLDADAVREIEC